MHYLEKLSRRPTPRPLNQMTPVTIQFKDKREETNINRALVLAKINAYVSIVSDKRQMEEAYKVPIVPVPKMRDSLTVLPSKIDTSPLPSIEATKIPESLVLEDKTVAKEQTAVANSTNEPTPDNAVPVVDTADAVQDKTVPVLNTAIDAAQPVAENTVNAVIEELPQVAPAAPIKRRRLKIVDKAAPAQVDLSTAQINGQLVSERLPKPEKINIKVPSYYMANRKVYTQKLNELFKEYNKQIIDEAAVASCDPKTSTNDVELMIHQKVVRDYLNLYTPYRGLLLYHGLGAGKTATSISIAEGMKSQKKVFVLTPASLKMNYFSELKKYGDPIFRKNQFWEFISIEGNPQYTDILSKALSIPREIVIRNRGAWLVDVTKTTSNFKDLSAHNQQMLDEQLNYMIRSKYVDINYNGLNQNKMDELTKTHGANPFDHSVVIIDEAHNLVSRIINKRNRPNSIPSRLYNMFLSATDARFVLLSGTPIVNYPSEVGILYNILRGYINTWKFNVKPPAGVTTEDIVKVFDKENFRLYDFMDYTNGELTVTRNPFGFVYMKKPGMEKGQHVTKRKMPLPPPVPLEKTIVVEKQPITKPAVSDVIEPVSNEVPTVVAAPATTAAPAIISGGKRKTHKRAKDSLELNKTRKCKTTFVNNEPDDVYESDSETQENTELNENPHYTLKDGIIGLTNPPPEPTSEINQTIAYEVERDYYKMQNGEGINQQGGEELVFDRYNGVHLNEQGNVSDEDFVKRVKEILRKHNYVVSDVVKSEHYKSLPDIRDDFNAKFIDEDSIVMKNVNVFKKRILGLTSYFRSAQESLLPQFVKTPNGEVYNIVRCEMSNFQLESYEPIRAVEREKERKLVKRRKKQEDEDKISSTYRIYSRLACNFTFPASIPRPLPMNNNNIEEVVEESQKSQQGMQISAESVVDNIANETDDVGDVRDDQSQPDLIEEYATRIKQATQQLKTEMIPVVNSESGVSADVNALSREGLKVLSPKFLEMLKNVESEEHKGLHLLYSNFRTLEGIGIFKLVLEQNGFTEFKVKKEGEEWIIDIVDKEKPRFALYTGTETAQEKELLRNIYNSNWDAIPPKMAEQLRELNANNYYGEIIKVLMITASGAEGINLENTRYVHIMEPYWHMTRLDQVVGRARRICSHKRLPEELRTVEVFLYVTVFSEAQSKSRDHIELMTSDTGRISKKPITTDEYLYEGSLLKYNLHNQILKSIKETAMDCNLYAKSNKSENLVCYGNQYGKATSNDFSGYPTIEEDERERMDINIRETVVSVQKLTLDGVSYVYNKSTNEVYDYNTYMNSKQMVLIGYLSKKGKTWQITKV